MTEPRGQAIAEFAFVAPVMLFVILGGVEAGFLVVDKAQQDRDTATVAQAAANRPGDESWHAVAARLFAPDCDVEVEQDGDMVTATSTCQYRPVATRGLWDGLPVSSSESVARPQASPEPTPTPTPEPSSSEVAP